MNTGSIIKWAVIIAVFPFLPVHCHKPDSDSGLQTENITVDNRVRRYALYVPPTWDGSPVPLVFVLHGGGVYIEDMTGESGHKSPAKLWMELADNEKFIVVYPEGLNGAYDSPTWNDCRGDCIVSSEADDVHFIEVLIDRIESRYAIDTLRIYASGTSNGGFMAQRLGVELSNKVAAVASVAAAKPAVSECTEPARPIPILFMNGTDDNHMPYDGGYVSYPPNPDNGSVLSTPETIDYWVDFNQAGTVPQTYTFPDLDPDDGGTVQKFTYPAGNAGAEVVLYKINGGGHSAPSIRERFSALYESYFNKQNHDIEMTTEVWSFFKDQSLY